MAPSFPTTMRCTLFVSTPALPAPRHSSAGADTRVLAAQAAPSQRLRSAAGSLCSHRLQLHGRNGRRTFCWTRLYVRSEAGGESSAPVVESLSAVLARIEALDPKAAVRVVTSGEEKHISIQIETAGEELFSLLDSIEDEETREDLRYMCTELDAYAEEEGVALITDTTESLVGAMESIGIDARSIGERVLHEYAILRRELFLGIAKNDAARIDRVADVLELQDRVDQRAFALPLLPALLAVPLSYGWHSAVLRASEALEGPELALLRDKGYHVPWIAAGLVTLILFPFLRVLGELSSSWEVGRRGSLLGLRELRANVATVRASLEDVSRMPLGLASRLHNYLALLYLFGLLRQQGPDRR